MYDDGSIHFGMDEIVFLAAFTAECAKNKAGPNQPGLCDERYTSCVDLLWQILLCYLLDTEIAVDDPVRF